MIKKNNTAYFIKSISIKIIIVFVTTLILAELTSKALVKFGFLNSGLPAWVSLRIHEDYAHWHPKKTSFILEKKNCWISKVSYDSKGLRNTSKFKYQKEHEFKYLYEIYLLWHCSCHLHIRNKKNHENSSEKT